ncbi:radical SAM protein [bacterium]|nr:radical SAM protein [bacterium]MCI0605411.1 radical SAM protein [bacterium]
MEPFRQKLHDTTSLCAVCKQGIPAEIWEVDGKILMKKRCSEHGSRDVLLASQAAWYHNTMSYPAVLKPPVIVRKNVQAGCPFDCGACTSHQQKVYLPVIPITSACNLDCPICYTINKNEGAFHMSLDEFARILDVIRENDPDMKIINLTGGEPTMHPKLTSIIRLCHDAGIHRVTISTHGLPFVKNEVLLEELAELRARIVLSFDSFDEEINKKMIGARIHSAKMKVLDQLEKYNVDTTLIPVIALGYNDHEIGKLVDLALHRDSIRSLEIHTMTFTGQGGVQFDGASRMTTCEVLEEMERSTEGKIRMDDFVPSPCAHPLCYQTCYLLQMEGGRYLPFTRFMSRDQIRELLTDNLYMEPGEKMESVLQDVINDLWSSDSDSSEQVLPVLKDLIQRLFPRDRISYEAQQRISERSAKTIYIHSHMDEENFDMDRVRQCCVGVPAADGTNTPTCSYNVLYRERDPRFSHGKLIPVTALTGGKKW